MRKIKKNELKVGMKVTTGEGRWHKVKSINSTLSYLTRSDDGDGTQGINLRSDGYWGANNGSGYLEAKEIDFKPFKPVKYILIYDIPNVGDPTEQFVDKPSLIKRIKELVLESKICLDSAEIFSVSKQSSIKLNIDIK